MVPPHSGVVGESWFLPGVHMWTTGIVLGHYGLLMAHPQPVLVATALGQGKWEHGTC